MLTKFFEWLDAHPGSFWGVALPATGLFCAYVFRAARRPAGNGLTAALDFLVLFCFLLAWRWPFLLSAEEYNPDESQFIAGAITLAQDPVFFRSVDGTTSGPLNFYALLPIHWLGLPLDYFTARVAALLANVTVLWLTLRTLSRQVQPAVAWISVLPAAALWATTWQGEFVHYASELVPAVLLAGAVNLVARGPSAGARFLFGSAFLAGLAPWAKLQAAPLAALIVGWGLWTALRSQRPAPKGLAAGVLAAGVLPTFIAAVLLLVFGQAEHAWRRYFLQNVVYVDHGMPVGEALRRMFGFATVDWRMPLFLASIAGFSLLAGVWWRWRRATFPALLVPALGLLLAGALAVVAPRREILHYTIFLIAPLTLVHGAVLGAGWTLASPSRRRWPFVTAVLLLTVAPLFVTRLFQPVPDMFGRFAAHWRHPRSGLGEVLNALARGEGALAIWGWAQRLWVETGLRQGTRDALTYAAIWPGDQQLYYRETFVADLQRIRPVLFLDVVGTDGYIFQARSLQGHEIHAPLAEEIRANYTLVRDTPGSRLYVRNDAPVLASLAAIDLAAAEQKGRAQGSLPHPAKVEPSAVWRRLGPIDVLLLQPPARAEWLLAEDVRSVVLEFGVVPEAYEQGTTNGVVLVAELEHAGHRREIYRRLLSPRQRPEHRGPSAAVITLPPFAAGSRLVLRSEPGEHGDAAWDWLYLARMTLRTSPTFLREQFPGYRRVPDAVDAPFSSLIGDGPDRELAVHAPARFRFRLDGRETRLRFSYGMHDGAYTEGQTDGAVFRVELARPGTAERVLFERYLQPARDAADRGPQTADLTIAGALDGDHLVLTLDPGPHGNAAWDWTYLRHVVLE